MSIKDKINDISNFFEFDDSVLNDYGDRIAKAFLTELFKEGSADLNGDENDDDGKTIILAEVVEGHLHQDPELIDYDKAFDAIVEAIQLCEVDHNLRAEVEDVAVYEYQCLQVG